jgi:putative ABC transport system permease protein
MVKNFLLIALRFMSRQRGFSVINISGLTLGIACSLLILLYIQDELSFDRFHKDYDRMYRVGFEGKLQGKKVRSTLTAFPLSAALQKEWNDIESATRIVKWSTFPVNFEGKAFTEDYLLLADKNFFQFFSFDLVVGNADSVLTGERKVVITESAAKRYFDYKGEGDRSPIGKTLEMAQGYMVRVSGIAKDPPANSHFHFTLVLSLDSWDVAQREDWISTQVLTYFKLKSGSSTTELDTKINQLLAFKLNRELQEVRKLTLQEFKAQGNELSYFIQPLRDIYLKSHLKDELETNGSIEYIYLFSCIAAFIIVLACINFMNLTTAQSASRAKEVAVRKAVGAQNNRLVLQFLLESYFYVVIAVGVAFFLLLGLLQPFNFFTGKHLSVVTIFQPQFLIGLLVFGLITGLVAGSYPSFYLTQYSPIEVLKGNLRARLRTYGIRNILVVFQFFISSSLIIATMVVYQQLDYVQRANLGFNKENIINLLHTRNLGPNGIKFKDDLLKLKNVVSASYCNRLPPNIDWQFVFRMEDSEKDFLLAVYEMDHEHLKTMGFPMVQGRFFNEQFPGDTACIILNQAAAERLGIKVVDRQRIFSSYDQPDGRVREVIGIIKDFNFQSLKDPIQPLAVVLGNEPNWEMAIRLKDDAPHAQALNEIETLYKKYAPAAPFEYTFVKENFAHKVERERMIGLLFMLFTILAILIACLGLFGLATFTAEQQRKAIGIRKVLGATIPDIVRMLNHDFLKLVLTANLIAWPVSWWIMTQWLDQFAFHVTLPWWIFLLAGAITGIIAFFSVSFQALKAAAGNPVNSLRNE